MKVRIYYSEVKKMLELMNKNKSVAIEVELAVKKAHIDESTIKADEKTK